MSIGAKFRHITPEIATFSRPFERFGFIHFGGRATAIKLRNGDVLLFSPIEFEDSIKEKLDSLGKLRYIIAPDTEHHLYLKQYSQKYPDALIVGVDGIEKIESTLKFAHVYGKHSNDKRVGYEDELEVAYFSGYINKDIAFLHKSSKTLIQADLLFNLPATEQYGSKEAALSGIARLVHTHFSPHSRLHRWLLMAGAKDKAAMKRDASTVADWEFNRVIPCHGDIIETGGKQAWLSAYESFLSPEGHKTN